MLLQPREFPEIDTSQVLREGVFSFMEGPVLFDMMSNKLYVHKEKAAIREICTNAADANRDAGRGDLPILIHAPSKDEPYFSVKDQGPGLTADELLSQYTTFGFSTKRRNADANGTLGLGCKSPMAYLMTFSKSPSFQVISVKAGRRCLVNYAVNAHGMPTPYLLSDEEAPGVDTGLEVKFECNPLNLGRFHQAMVDVLQWFEAPFKLAAGHTLKIPKHEVLAQLGPLQVIKGDYCDNFDGSFGFYVVMANVAYPVSMAALPLELQTRFAFLNGNRHAFLKVPNGAVDFSIAREGLEYNPHTFATLQTAAVHVRAALEEKLQRYETVGAFTSNDFFADLPWLTRLFRGSSASIQSTLLYGPRKARSEAYERLVSSDWGPNGKLFVDQTLDSPSNFTTYSVGWNGLSHESMGVQHLKPTRLMGGRIRVVYMDTVSGTRLRKTTGELFLKDLFPTGDLLIAMGAPNGKPDDESRQVEAKRYFDQAFGSHPLLFDVKFELLSDVAPDLLPKVVVPKTEPISSPSSVYDARLDRFVSKKYYSKEDTKNTTHYIVVAGLGRMRASKDLDGAHVKYCETYPEETARIRVLIQQLQALGGRVGEVLVYGETSNSMDEATRNGFRGYGTNREASRLANLPSLTQAVGAAAWALLSKKFSAKAVVRACLDPANSYFPESIPAKKDVFEEITRYHDSEAKCLSTYLTIFAQENLLPAEFATLSESSSFAFFAQGARACPEAEVEAAALVDWLAPFNRELAAVHLKLTPLGALTGKDFGRRDYRHKGATFNAADLTSLMVPGASKCVSHGLRSYQALQPDENRITLGDGKRTLVMPRDEAVALLKVALTLPFDAQKSTRSRIWSELDAIHETCQLHTKIMAISRFEQINRR